MLRKESEAVSERDKFDVFEAFMRKEMRIRMILYGLEGNDLDDTPSTDTKEPRATMKASLQRNDRTQVHETIPYALQTISSMATTETSKGTDTPEQTQVSTSKLAVSKSTMPNSTSSVAVDEPDAEAEYSPGGRPRLTRPNIATNNSEKNLTISGTAVRRQTLVLPGVTTSPSDNAPMLLSDYFTGPESPGRNAPIVLDTQDLLTRPSTAPVPSQNPLGGSVKFEPPRPVYTPFRYNEVNHQDLEESAFDQSAYQAYSAMRNQTADSGRILAQVGTKATSPKYPKKITSPSSARREHEETFLGLIRQQSQVHRNDRPIIPSATKQRPTTPANLLVSNAKNEAVFAISALLPSGLPVDQWQPPKIRAIYEEIRKIPDEFAFIHDAVVRWDRNNKEIREKQDRERQIRQEESESHIDALFNDNEIGYSDIGAMEADFKLTEAKRKYEEDQKELDSFVTQIFESVTDRLQNEIFRLNAQYILAIDLLDLRSDAASHYATHSEDRVLTSQAMELVLLLFNKLQIRYQKVAEAHFERERRRKKLELTVLYANGDVAAVKRLEQEFMTAEKLQVLHEDQERNTRV